jgi:ethanolamine utilization protein EutQ
MSVTRFTINDPTVWYQADHQDLFVADVLDEHNSATMSVGFARYAKGAWNDWTLADDEVLIVTKGHFAVQSSEGVKWAKAGEVLFLTRGTKLVYRADEDTELVYVTYPRWADAREPKSAA